MERPSPLFVPALWEGDRFKLLDETLLPWKLQYIPVTEVAGAVRAVKEMKTRAFGQVLTFLYAAALVVRESGGGAYEPLREKLTELAECFTEARPTFGFRGILQRLLDRCEECPPGGEVRKWAEEKIHEFIAAIVAGRERRARFAAELLPNPCLLMTHCNISGELVAVAQHCRVLGKDLRVIATETRPYLQGSRLTAWEVARAGIQVAVIPDCAIAQVMSGGGVNAVLVGSDRNARNGDVINKVGTYPLALMAKEYGIPFYALVQDPGPLATGEEVTIEERPVHEFLNFQGRSLAPHVTEGRYPSFDITPARLISYLVGFDDALTPEDFRKKFQKVSPTVERKESGRRRLLLYGMPPPDGYAHLVQVLKAEEAESFLVPEMRPGLWGAQLVSRELVKRNISTVLISDNIMGTLFAQGEIRHLYLFYESLDEEGAVGMCGSLLAVLLARAHGVPVELLNSGGPQGSPPDSTVSTFLGEKMTSEGVSVYPIEKDRIPLSLFRQN